MTCAKCGGVLEAGARFCGECGTPFPVAAPPPVMPPPPPTATASRRGLIMALGGVGIGGIAGVGFLTYVRTATAVPPTATPSGPRRVVVDASGGGDYQTIATAVLGARGGDTIVLRPGTYREPRGITISNDVRIVGEGGRSRVIVEGAPAADVFSFVGGSATLTGLTIRVVGTGPADAFWGAIGVYAGTPVIEDCDLTSSAGSAVGIWGAGANPVIRNCTIRDSLWAGVHVFDQGQGTFEKCVISGNGHDGVVILTGGNPTVRDCEIRDNWHYGVLVFDQGRGTVEKCVISGNGRSGVEILTGGNPNVRDCGIRDNKGYGVCVFLQGQGTFTGNTLAGNGWGAWDIGRNAGRVTRTGNLPNG